METVRLIVSCYRNKQKLSLTKGQKGEKREQIPDLKRTVRSYDTSSTEKLEEVSEEDQFDTLLKVYQTKSGNKPAE